MATSVTRIYNNNSILTGSVNLLVNSVNQVRSFGVQGDFVEMNVSNPAGSLLFSLSNFKNYTFPGNYQANPSGSYVQELIFDPGKDLKDIGAGNGDYTVNYDILRPKIINTSDKLFFIKEISSDRTEIRLSSNNTPNNIIEEGTLSFINEFQNINYFKEFYINLGQGNLFPAINIALDQNTTPFSVLIKLLNPLPFTVSNLSTVSIVDKISNTQTFSVKITPDPLQITYPSLRGPNFDLELDNVRVNPTDYYNLDQITTSKTSINSQLQNLLGLVSSSQFQINVDYNDYNNFIHFSSAQQRLDGFYYKLDLIETYVSASASAASVSNTSAQLDAQNYQYKINNIVQGFDGYEQFLYYESGSYSWPKINSTKPYINTSTSSLAAFNFYTSQSISASDYDNGNQDYLVYTLPTYVNENSSNQELFKFIGSIGTMFDEIWLYTKAMTDLYKSKNALDQGISKDLVYYALQSMGVNVYTDQDGQDVFQYLYGVNPDGTYLPNTGSYQTLVSASNYQISGQDVQKGFYKRLYHSLPLLLKSKGTTRFIQYLNTVFGIPPTVMSYIEYGGVDKSTTTTEYEYDRFTYGLNTELGDTVSVPWIYTSQSLARTGSSDIVPNGIEFRFKAVPSSSGHDLTNYTPQTLLSNTSGFNLDLVYTPIGKADSIYSGSKSDFGYLEFTLGATTVTSSTVPIFVTGSDGETSWYNILVQRRNPNLRVGQTSTSQTYDVYIKNNVWGDIGHVASASLTSSTQNASWYNQGILTLGDASTTGSFQEFRLWSNYLSESKFDFHVLNPESIESNYTSSTYNDLTARFPLGNNLYTYNHSVTTTVPSTAPNQTIQSFTASFSNFSNTNNYFNFVERYYANVANSGYANPVTDKVRIYSGSIYGTQLLPNKSIEITPLIPITKDIHLLDAGLSPQDEINKDIIAHLGSTYDLDNMIGDPRGTGYDELEDLRVEYFKKYVNKYNYKDFITLIEYFHNSLFRTLKDFTPARTNPATGIIIKNHLLERPAVETADVSLSRHNNQSGSIDLLYITASNAMGVTQPTYSYTINSNLGPINMISDARDFFTGELPSSSIFIHDDFDIANYNPFALEFDSDKTGSYSSSVWNVEFNPLLNNVELNQTSSIRKKITLIGGSAGFVSGSVYVTESIQLQDFTYTYARHINPRYIGSNTTSTNYNIYTTDDDSYNTFGKNAAIDKNTRQFAFFSEILISGSDYLDLSMPERSNVYLKYLIDENSNLTELTKRNYDLLTEDQKYNLYQVQNIFKSGETVNIGLFDNQNPSRQQLLDGNKTIYAGGYKFHPVLWNRTGTSPLVYNLVTPKLTNITTQTGGVNYNVGNFTINVTPRSSGGNVPNWYFDVTVTSNVGPIGQNIFVGVLINYVQGGNPYGFAGFQVPINIGQTQGFYQYNTYNSNQPTNIVAGAVSVLLQSGGGGAPGGTSTYSTYVSTSIDINPVFKVHVSQSNVLIASSELSLYYPGVVSSSYVSNGFYFTGNDAGSPLYDEANYAFQLNPGDIIRLYNTGSSAAGFSVLEEYEISKIFLPTITQPSLSFALSRNVDYGTFSSLVNNTGSINKYIISRKILDETNVVINYRKPDGQTSSGIAKNINLAAEVDVNIANIVSELKSKLFATVLIP